MTTLCIASLSRACRDRDEPKRPAPQSLCCYSCRDRLEQLFAETPALYSDLGLMLRRQSVNGAGKVSGSGEEPTFVSGLVVEARKQLLGVLASWARVVSEDRGFTAPVPGVQAVSGFLLTSVDWICAQPFADELCSEVDEATSEAKRRAYPGGARHITLKAPDGSLVRCVERLPWLSRGWVQCPGVLEAVLREYDVARGLNPSDIHCSFALCGFTVEPRRWYRFGERWLRRQEVA